MIGIEGVAAIFLSDFLVFLFRHIFNLLTAVFQYIKFE